MAQAPFKQIADMLGRSLDGAMLINEDGAVVVWNKAAERLLGFRAREVIGRQCRDVLEGQSLAGAPLCSRSCPIGGKLAQGGGVHNFNMQAHTKSGRLVWLNISSLAVPSGRKRRFLAMHLFRDITEQARAQALVRELSSILPSPPAEGLSRPATDSAQPCPAHSEVLSPIQQALPLSEREREILAHLASGKNTKRIAETLYISPATVRNHIQHILARLGAHSRLEALAIAFRPDPRTA